MRNLTNVVLKRVEEVDLGWLMEQRNNPELNQYFRQIKPINLSEQHEWYKAFIGLAYIVLNRSFVPIGYVSLSHIDWVARHAEFGVFIVPSEQGKGYGKSAMEELLAHAFLDLNLNKVYSDVIANNPCIENGFYEKLGFKYEGQLRQQYLKGGKYLDSVFIGILKNEYLASGDGQYRQKALQESSSVGPVG